MIRSAILWLMMLAYPLFSGPLYWESLGDGADSKAIESIPEMEKRVFELANQERAKAGAPPLKWNNNLALAARLHSDEMAHHKQLSHQFSSEAELGARLAQHGARFDADAENVGYAGSADELHSGWMNSPPHRGNMLNPRYDEMGVGITRVGDRLYATQDFTHAVAKFSSQQGADEVSNAYKELRKSARLQPVRVVPSSSLQNIACSDQPGAKVGVSGNSNYVAHRYIVNYTTSDLTSFPSNLRQRLTDPSVRTVEVGVCGRQDAAHGFSGYRVVAVLY
jgi:Cysteine-rich secretory protein family